MMHVKSIRIFGYLEAPSETFATIYNHPNILAYAH